MSNSDYSISNLVFHAPRSSVDDPGGSSGQAQGSSKKLFCKFCPGTTFHNADEFCYHLRSTHCSKEGGSYGRNNVCQMLPIEGVSDEDYERHIRRLHADLDHKIDMDEYSDNDDERSIASLNKFNVNSFTQNLSSVLADPKRSKTETLTFFTRHWGDQFVPKVLVHPAPSIPKITVEHFRQYLTTTAKKHRQYLRAKRALKKALARHAEQTCIDPDELPTVFLDPKFSLQDPEIFCYVFMEPNTGESDKLVSEAEKRRAAQASSRPGTSSSNALSRQGSITSLISTQSLQPHVPIDAGNGQYFRPYQFLHNRLEFFHDTVGSMLNHQLESKNEAFWKTVHSYGTLHGQLEDAKSKIHQLRQHLKTVDSSIYDRLQKIIKLHQARENREKLLQRLEDIACLRDAQSTVQMLLNQNDYPKALECIETAQEVLSSDLRGVICFRHLSSQLQELHKVIAKMLHEEFVTLIQKEFFKPLEKESEVGYQEGQLPAVIQGLLRCKEYKFIQVLKNEIVEAVKNSLRQIIKNRIVECGAELTEFDPSLGNLGDQMRKMNFDQWLATLNAVFNSLYLLCRRVQSIQELILDNAQRVQENELRRSTSPSSNAPLDSEKPEKPSEKAINIPISASSASLMTLERKLSQTSLVSAESMPPSVDYSTASTETANDQNSMSSNRFLDVENDRERSSSATPTLAPSAVSILAMPCRDIGQLKSTTILLVEHTACSAQERSCKLLVARSKDGFLEKCTAEMFHEVEENVKSFVDRLDTLVASTLSNGTPSQTGALSPTPPQTGRSPLLSTLQNETTKFITRFHETKRQKLSAILDSEQWRASEVPRLFQKMMDNFEKTGKLKDSISKAGEDMDSLPENEPKTQELAGSVDFLMVEGEKYYVVGTSLLLLRMMAQYCDLLELFPQCVSELLLHIVELLKNFNSRTCQLILGAGALQLVGLKTISVKNLALASRCLQLISRFIPVVRTEFEEFLPPEKKNQLRYFDQTLRDYQDHINEISNKLLSVLEYHLVNGLNEWEINGQVPSAAFQQVVRQIGKFYNGFANVMSPKITNEMLLRVHDSFKSHLRQVLQTRSITPYDPLTYGLVSQDFAYYMENMKSLPACQDFPEDTLTEVFNMK